MGELVNLRLARKRKARAEKSAAADVRRAAFGRSKAEKQASADERRRQAEALEGHRREPGPEGDCQG